VIEMPVRLYWLTGLLGAALLVSALMLLNPADVSEDETVRFDQASRCEETLGRVPLNNQGIILALGQAAVIPKDCWRPVTLPENNPAQGVKVDVNNPQLLRIWYRVRYKVPEDWVASKPLMVYVPRIVASAWQIRIGGRFDADNRYEWRSTWNRPAAATFFAEMPPPNRMVNIDVGVMTTVAYGYSMARISVGDASVIRSQKAFREYLQVTMPQASSAVMLLLGLFFMSFWWVRRSETEYLLLSFTSLTYSVTNLRYAVTQPGDPNLDTWFYALVYEVPNYWITWLVYLVAARFAHYSNRCLEWLLWWYLITCNLSAIYDIFTNTDFALLRGIASISISFLFIGAIVRQAIITQSIGLRVVALALVIGVLGGFNDVALLLNFINPEGFLLSPYCGLLIFTAFFHAIQRRYVAAITGQELLNADLAQRLSEREAVTLQLTAHEAELHVQHIRLRELERVQTLANERQRLMHDMHDGLGSSLLSTLAAIEKNKLSQQAVAEALRTCIDDLRLVIDSLEPTANDLVTLLATIRYRLGQRLNAAGLELVWEITDLPPLPWLESPDALNVLRLVQEALVNVLKHANASSVQVSTHDLGKQVEIQIADNGMGFDACTITPGRGMYSQAKRAERLGGELHIDSTPGFGTCLRLLLPVNKNPLT
jgi:signal transduction histidine kinase